MAGGGVASRRGTGRGSEREVGEQLRVDPVLRERTLHAARVALADVRAQHVEQAPEFGLLRRPLGAQLLEPPVDARVALQRTSGRVND